MVNGELLKSSRKKIGFTQQGLADYFGVPQQRVSYWESNQRPIPKKVLKVAREVRKTKKAAVLKRFKRSSLKSSPQSSTPVKSPKNDKNEKPHLAQLISNPNLMYLQGGFCSKNSPSETFSACSAPKQEDSTFLPPAEDSMEGFILETYTNFKKRNGRFPTERDFIDGRFKEVEREEVLKYFGGLRTAKKLAGQLMRCQRRGYRKKEPIHTLKATKSGKDTQTAITYIDPDDKYNWLKALYPERNFNTYRNEVKARDFTWNELFKYRPESERLVPQIAGNEG